MNPTPTPTPIDSFVKIEFVSWSLLLTQIFWITVCIAAIVIVWRYLKSLEVEEPTTEKRSYTFYPREAIMRTGRIEIVDHLPIELINDDSEDEEESQETDSDYQTCSYCGTSNYLDALDCAACGAPRQKAFA